VYSFSKNSLAKLLTVHADLQSVMLEAIANSPIDFGISHGIRTLKEQQDLYALGRTKPGNIVTKCDGVKLRSKHQDGLAVDVFAFVNWKLSYDPEHLALIAGVVLSSAARLRVKIRWGGTFGSKVFKGWDKPHFEL
jgi:peptidoglycan L-alanyl-D-glutamate endopeptidase CwlK